MTHYDVKYCTTGVGKKEQNGDVEAANGALKRRVDQALMLRGSREFESVQSYEGWLQAQVMEWNRSRQSRFESELSVMRKVNAPRLPDYKEERKRVTSQSTVRVSHNTYSVPSRLIGHEVRIRLYEQTLEVWRDDRLEVTTDRLRGRFGHRIDYRHVIWSLVKKPGAFARYRYREDLFPSLIFRKAYDVLTQEIQNTKQDLEYCRILFLAATTMECEVEQALNLLLEGGERLTVDAVKELVVPTKPEVPEMAEYRVELSQYDTLLSAGGGL